MDTNVKSVFFLTQKLADILEKSASNADPSRIINIGSIDGIGIPRAETYSYPASKAAVHQLTRVLANRLANRNINVNAISPCPFQSNMMAHTLEEFGEENIGEKILEASKEKPDKQFNFIHAVEPTEDYERALGETGTKLPVHSCHVCVEDKMKVRTGGYNEFPYLVPRWSKATGEIFGRSPSYNALPDIKTLNKAVEIGLKAWAKAIDPPLLVQDDGVIGRVRMTPAGITVVRNDGAIKPLQIGSNWQITDMKENQLRTAIRQAYYSDQLQLQDGPQMTATEVQVRYELMQRLLGPTLGRFQSEFLNPLIERTFGIMFRAGALLPEPDVIKGQQIDVEYVGPLARSQRMEEAVAIERLYTLAMNVVQVDPTIMDNINHDEAIRLRSTLLGVPKSVLRGKDEVQAMREMRAEEQQAMAEAQQQQVQGDAMQSQAKAAKDMADPQVQEMMESTQEDMGIAQEEMI